MRRRSLMNPQGVPSCPACGVGPERQIMTTVAEEQAWLCHDCGCLRSSARFWFNLDEQTLDPMPNDDWMGASGAELRETPYEAYPHNWDHDLAWCRSLHAIRSGLYSELATLHSPEGRDLLDIPAWIIRRALVALPEQYRQEDIW